MNHGPGLGSAPRALVPNARHQQYQQQQQFSHQHPQQHLYQQRQQPHHVGLGLHQPEAPSQGTPDDHQRRVVETCDIRDERMTEADMREALSSYIIYRLEKVPGGQGASDDNDRAAAPTWQNIFRTEIRDMSAQAAAQRVRELGRERRSLPEKKAALISAQQRQVEKALEELESAERDPRYCFVLAQLDRQTERMSDEDYLRDERNWGRFTEREREKARYYGAGEKGGKKISVAKGRGRGKEYKEKVDKAGQKKETTSITVFYKRKPRDDVDVVAMYREGTGMGTRDSAAQSFRQQQSPIVSQHQPMHALQQHQGPQYTQQLQHLQPQQNSQHPQHPQHAQSHQHLLQQYPQHHQQGNFQQSPPPPPPPPGPQLQFPIRTKVPPPPGSKGPIPPPPPPPKAGKSKPIVVQPPAKPRKEPLREAKVIQPARKAGVARGKKHHALSPRSSDSSLSDDLFSCDTGTSRSSDPSESWGAKRGRSKARERGRGRRARSESSESSRSRSRSRGRDRGRGSDGRNRPELYGVRKQHARGDRAYVSPALAGDMWGVPPPPPSTEAEALSPAALKTVFDLGKAQGQREAERNLEPVAPRIVNVRRVVSRTRDDGDWADDKVYQRPGYERGRDVDGGVYERGYQSVSDAVRGNDRAYHIAPESPARRFDGRYQTASDDYSDGPRGNDRAYHPAPEGLNRPFESRYQTSDDYSDAPRGNGRTYHPAPEGPRPSERRYQTSDDYSDDYEYTHTPDPGLRGAERREYTVRDVPRRPRVDVDFMSGGLRDREEPRQNAFAPRRRYGVHGE